VNQRVPLFGVVSTEAQARSGAKMIRNMGLPPESIRFLIIPSNSIWIRDYAPFILRYDQENVFMVDGKYHTRTMRENRKQDDFMCFELARMLDLPVRSIPLVLEGGNFISNGDGLLITSAKTISVNQQGEYTNKQLISMFSDFLGVNGVCAVNHLKSEPNGHIDMFMTMLGKNLAVVAEIDPAVDSENSAILNEAARIVSSYTTSDGPITVKRIPMPPQSGNDWRSYTNIIMANGALLMPSFSNVDPAIENQAEQVYLSILPPDWEVKRINCDKLVALRGQLHCLSYNIPKFIPIDGLLENAILQNL
jgi:agmatine/peptidylarginine deiminase